MLAFGSFNRSLHAANIIISLVIFLPVPAVNEWGELFSFFFCFEYECTTQQLLLRGSQQLRRRWWMFAFAAITLQLPFHALCLLCYGNLTYFIFSTVNLRRQNVTGNRNEKPCRNSRQYAAKPNAIKRQSNGQNASSRFFCSSEIPILWR